VSDLSRVLSVVGLLALIGGPMSTAPALAQSVPVAQVAPAAASTSQVSGLVTDTAAQPVSGAVITLRGPRTYTATSDAQGRYTIAGVVPGVYSATVSRTGFQSGTEQDVAVTAGAPINLNVQLVAPTLSTLRVIGSTRTTFSRSTFNSSPASVSILNTQTFIDQGQPQVKSVLNQTPGIQISLPATSGNAASPGAITFPNIRGGLAFETSSLIDGHALSNGAFGNYVSTFLNSFTLGSIEVIKGPGAAAPEVNNAIGGTVNFRTLDPTRRPSGYEVIGVDSFGGGFSNFGYSNTVMNGKLGFVLDYAVNGTPGPLRDFTTYAPVNAAWTINGQAIASTTTTSPVPPGFPTQSSGGRYFNQTSSLIYSGMPISSTYTNKTELVKVRYNFSQSSSLVASYLGSQTWTEQNGNHFYLVPSLFTPGAAYSTVTGPQSGSTTLLEDNVFPLPHEWEINNEPIFQGEFRTSLGNNTILLRGYSASISRLQYNGMDRSNQQAILNGVGLFGTASLCPVGYTAVSGACRPPGGGASIPATPTAFNGKPVSLNMGGQYFQDSEEDRLHGYSLEIDHPFGGANSGNLFSVAYDTNKSASAKYQVGTYAVGCASCRITVSPTSSQLFSTLLVRAIYNPGTKTQLTFSNYFNNYNNHFSTDFGSTFQDSHQSHYDARLAATYRAAPNVSLRAAAGSAIAPPYIFLYGTGTSTPLIDRTSQAFATNTQLSPGLRPETAFGYNLGGDARLGGDGQTIFSMDVYRTNLWNQLISSSQYPNGNVNVHTFLPGDAANNPTGPIVNVPLFSSGPTNLARARYDGLEISLRRQPALGFGYILQTALQHAAPISPPLSFYTAPGSTVPTRNLGVVPGQNFYGGFQGVSNQPISYSQAYGEISFRTAKNFQISFGETYYGPNNSLFQPPFLIANFNVRQPLSNGFYFNVNIDNVFNTLGNSYITEYGGAVIQPVVAGATFAGAPIQGATLNSNTYGPRNVRLSISKSFGRGDPSDRR
jgi:outer membrane receptor protein involved in Fe transport